MALNEIYLEIFGFYGSPVKKVPDPCCRVYQDTSASGLLLMSFEL